MARRKKTPDVLSDQQLLANLTIKERSKRADTLATEPLPNTELLSQESAPDPLAMLFPRLANAPTPFTTTIKLTVTATEDLAKEVENAVSQALGALPHVRVVTKEADWRLVILSVVVQSQSRTPEGVALSVVVVETPKEQLQEQQHAQTNLLPTISSEQLRIFHGSWLRVAARSQLPRLCQQIVTDFTERYLVKRQEMHGQ